MMLASVNCQITSNLMGGFSKSLSSQGVKPYFSHIHLKHETSCLMITLVSFETRETSLKKHSHEETVR